MVVLKKQFKFILFAIAFIIIAPLIVLYASGDIFVNGWNFLQTGGIYVAQAPIGTQVYLNGKPQDSTSFFSRSILIKGLHPGTYTVTVSKDGYNPWKETVKVSANLVFEADVFILPFPVPLTPIPLYLSKIVGTTTVETKNKNPQYAAINAVFLSATTTVTTQASGTLTIARNELGTPTYPLTQGDLSLWQNDGKVFIGWSGDVDGAPQYMCPAAICQPEIEAVNLGATARHIDFLPGFNDVILVASGNDVFAIQAEANPDKQRNFIYHGISPDFIIVNGSIYIKDQGVISKVSL